MAAKKKETGKEPDVKPQEDSSDDKLASFEKKLEEMNKFQESTRDFIDGATVVINTLASSPELTNAFQSELKKRYGVDVSGEGSSEQPLKAPEKTETAPPATPPGNDVVSRVEGVELSQREQVVRDFEDAYGISKLKGEERTEARRKIEGFLNDFGQSVKTIPLPTLRKTLDKAYLGSHAEQLREEGRLEGMTQMVGNAQGVMGTISSTTPGSETEEGLSPKQVEWAKKLNVDPEKAKETYLKRDQESERVPESEAKS